MATLSKDYPLLSTDELEVEALFERELGKMYNEDNPEDDMVEKVRFVYPRFMGLLGPNVFGFMFCYLTATFFLRRKSVTECGSTCLVKWIKTKIT